MHPLVQRLLGIACVTVGAFSFVEGAKVVLASFQSSTWPVATGQVLSSEVLAKNTGRRWHKPEVRYRYSVDGIAYMNTRVWFLSHGTTLEGTAEEVVAAYPANSAVAVFYNPANPSESALRPGLAVEPVLGCALTLLVALGGFVMLRDGGAVRVARSAA
jgi:Protein of unknown function (DUF3592)